MNTNIENCNTELLEEQKEQLYHQIINGTNKDYFWISDIEAGCRKTRTAELALADMCKKTKHNAIFVRLNNKDCRESARIINKLAGYEVAFAYNNEDVNIKNRYSVQKNFLNIRILIITHPKYRVLAHDKTQRNIFAKDRKILVVDEFVSEIERLQLSDLDIKTYEMIFKEDRILWEQYTKIVQPFRDWINGYFGSQGKGFARIKTARPVTEIKNFIKLIKANIRTEQLQKIIGKIVLVEHTEAINSSLLMDIKTVSQLCINIQNITEFFTHVSLYDNSTFYTTNCSAPNWKLENNIILDAGSELQVAYEFNNELYKVQHNGKVLDHYKWKIINIKINTTTSSKEKMNGFYKVVNQKIKKYRNEIVVIGSKNELDKVELPDENKCYFGNITGSNEYASKKHVAVIQTHNLSDIDYILKYLHYSKDYINNNSSIATRSYGRKSTHRYGFLNPELEKIRCMWIAQETYQAIKRVNRNMISDTDALLFMNNDEVIELIQSQMKNCKIEVEEISDEDVGYEEDNRDKYAQSRRKNSYASKFIALLTDIQNGRHKELMSTDFTCKKKVLREYLGIKNASNFSQKVLLDTDVISFCQIKNIDTRGQTIRFGL